MPPSTRKRKAPAKVVEEKATIVSPVATRSKSVKKAPKKKEVEEEPEDEDDDDDAMSESDDESDYSDLDEDQKSALKSQDDVVPLTTEKLKTLEPVAKKALGMIKKETAPMKDRGVIYLGHIPYGFFEDQMQNFFTQFGEVTRLRLSRSKKTGRSRHYAFIEFKSRAVARIVAETMDNYMMFERTLVCQYIEPEKVHPNMFAQSGKTFRPVPWQKIARERHNRTRDANEQKQRVKTLLSKDAKRRKKLEALGIDYKFDGYAGEKKAKSTRKVFTD